MSRLVAGDHVARFVGDAVGRVIVPPYSTIGLEADGDIKFGMVFNHWTGPDIHASCAGERRYLTRGFLREVGRYVYGQLGCERMTVITEQPRVADYVQRAGGQVEGTMRNHFGVGRDGTILGVLRDDWRF